MFYIIEDPTESELEVLKTAAGSYGNTDDEAEEGDRVCEWLGDKWLENEVDATKAIDAPLDLVICLGIYL